MSNIPFNTVASVLATAPASRQAAAGNVRRSHEALRAQRVQAQTSVRHMEEVEDLDEKAVDSVGDEQEKRNQGEGFQRRKEEPEEQVELSAEAKAGGGDAKRPAKKLTPEKPRLDISA